MWDKSDSGEVLEHLPFLFDVCSRSLSDEKNVATYQQISYFPYLTQRRTRRLHITAINAITEMLYASAIAIPSGFV